MEFVENMYEALNVDANVKNRFKFEWLSEKDCHGELYVNYIRKSKEPGVAFCVYCHDFLNYGTCGKQSFVLHAKRKKHTKFRTLNLSEKQAEGPETPTSSASAESVQPTIALADRKSNMEATILSFVSEHSLGFSMIPQLVDFVQEMNRDPDALSVLQMSRQSGTYKMTDGLAPALRQKLVHDLRQYKFSINLDVCSNNENKRVLTVLASYYSEEAERVIVQHYRSTEVKSATAESVYQAVTYTLEKDIIPLENLVSVLSDSRSDIEVVFRERIPHLLNIGGETCHDIHDIVKEFCGHFDSHLEDLHEDILVDMEYSPEFENYLMDICAALEINFEKLQQRQGDKCLSVYDCVLPFERMLSALSLLYWTWLPAGGNSPVSLYNELLPSDPGNRRLVQDIHTECRQLHLTTDSMKRKIRIAKKLLSERAKTYLLLNIYISFLKKFKVYVEVFQRNEPMVHKIFDRQQELLRWILQCFLKVEEVNKHKDHLKRVEVKDESLHLPDAKVYISVKAREFYNSIENKDEVKEELETLKKACVHTAECMQKKFCTNQVVKQLSALDPKACGYTATHVKLTGLVEQNFRQTMSMDERGDLEVEARMMQIDSKLPKFEENMRIDEWWTLVFHCREYPTLARIVKPCLSIFTYPQVEPASRQTEATSKVDTKTLGALHTIRFYLRTKDTPQRKAAADSAQARPKEKRSLSLKAFHRDDVLKDPVDAIVCRHMLKAHATYTTDKRKKVTKKLKHQRSLTGTKQRVVEGPSTGPANCTKRIKVEGQITTDTGKVVKVMPMDHR